MRKIFLVFFFILGSSILSLSALAEQQVPVNVSGGGAADLLNMTTMPPALQDSHENDDGVRHFCTDRYGRIVQQADPNYADCLRNKKAIDPLGNQPAVTQPTGAQQNIAPAGQAQPSANEKAAAKAAGGAP